MISWFVLLISMIGYILTQADWLGWIAAVLDVGILIFGFLSMGG